MRICYVNCSNLTLIGWKFGNFFATETFCNQVLKSVMTPRCPERKSGIFSYVNCSNLTLIGWKFGNFLLQERFLTKFWLFSTSDWWKVIILAWVLIKKASLSLEKSYKANKGQKGHSRPMKAIKGQKLQNFPNLCIISLNTLLFLNYSWIWDF